MSGHESKPDLPPLHWRAALRLMHHLPQGALSRAFGSIADTPLPRSARAAVLSSFAKLMGINVQEAEKPFEEYASINEFFVRRLRPGARIIDADPAHVVSPVDGVVGQLGKIHAGELLQAKGRTYTAAALLGDPAQAERYIRGSFATIYLSPRHYHRIHAPAGGEVNRADHLPGALFPVNTAGVMHVDALFPRNERMACYVAATAGDVVVVAVGAYNVGRISAAFDPAWRDGAHVTNRAGAVREIRRYSPSVPVSRGEEIMAFHLGSTVVMLFERPITFAPSAVPGAEITMGSTLGTVG
ncbi:MAG: archaetidylserine decarboxylase [Longimicrobiales bacterium]